MLMYELTQVGLLILFLKCLSNKHFLDYQK